MSGVEPGTAEEIVKAIGCNGCVRSKRSSTTWFFRPCQRCCGDFGMSGAVRARGWVVCTKEAAALFARAKVPLVALRARAEVKRDSTTERLAMNWRSSFNDAEEEYFAPSWVQDFGDPIALARPYWVDVVSIALVDLEARDGAAALLKLSGDEVHPADAADAVVALLRLTYPDRFPEEPAEDGAEDFLRAEREKFKLPRRR